MPTTSLIENAAAKANADYLRPKYADELARLDALPYWQRRAMICHVMGYLGVTPERLRDAVDSAMVAVEHDPRDDYTAEEKSYLAALLK